MQHLNYNIREIKATFLNLSKIIKKREKTHKEIIKSLIEIKKELKNLKLKKQLI